MQRPADPRLLSALVLAAIACGVAAVLLLTAVFGSPSIGVKCWRRDGDRQCAVLQSRFFGLSGNSAVSIPESEIAGAETLWPVHGVGSRGGGSYTVSLELKSGPYRHYPVLSSQSFGSADAATRKLNAYLADPTARSIELHEDIWASILIPFIPVVLVVAVAVVAARWRRQRVRP